METISAAPVPTVKITYNGKNITAELAPYLVDVTYVDKLNGQADELDITLADMDSRWLDAWYPEKGAEVKLEYGYSHLPLVSAGAFLVDEIELDGPPTTVRIRALAAGLTRQARTRLGKAYEKTTLKAILEKVAKRLKAQLVGTIADIKIDKATQYGETDWAFVVRLCREYGYEVKLTDANQQLVVTKLKDLTSGLVRTFKPSDLTHWNFRDKITEVPAKTDVKHHDPDKKKLVKGSTPASSAQTSSDTRKRSIPATSSAQAKALSDAEQERHEIDKTALTIALPGEPKLVAGAAFGIAELGKVNGTYIVTESRHAISKSSGYTTEAQGKKMKEAA